MLGRKYFRIQQTVEKGPSTALRSTASLRRTPKYASACRFLARLASGTFLTGLKQGFLSPCLGLRFRTIRLLPSGGFTVIEVLVSMAIFSIAILGLSAGAVSVMRATQTSYFQTIALNLGQDKLEELKATTVTNLPNCPQFANCSEVTPPYSGLTFTRSWMITADAPVEEVTQIDVKVDWTDYTTRSLTISSVVKQ